MPITPATYIFRCKIIHVATQRPKYVAYLAKFSCFLRPKTSESEK